MEKIEAKIARLVRKTSSTLPKDALVALKNAIRREEKGSSARMVLEKEAKVESTAIRQMREEVKKMLNEK